MKPCITTCPDIVPTVELDSPEAVSASAKSTLEAPPRSGSSVRCAPSRESMLVSPLPKKTVAATTSIAMLIRPAITIAMSDVDARVSVKPLRLLVVSGDDPVLRERGMQVDHVRHHRRADDPDCEQNRLVAGELGHDRVLRDLAQWRMREPELGEVTDADHRDECGDHRLERAEPVPLEPEDQQT